MLDVTLDAVAPVATEHIVTDVIGILDCPGRGDILPVARALVVDIAGMAVVVSARVLGQKDGRKSPEPVVPLLALVHGRECAVVDRAAGPKGVVVDGAAGPEGVVDRAAGPEGLFTGPLWPLAAAPVWSAMLTSGESIGGSGIAGLL